jgi:hypothetical protein
MAARGKRRGSVTRFDQHHPAIGAVLLECEQDIEGVEMHREKWP